MKHICQHLAENSERGIGMHELALEPAQLQGLGLCWMEILHCMMLHEKRKELKLRYTHASVSVS